MNPSAPPLGALTRFLEPGARVFVPTMSNQSAAWLDALAADPERARGVTFCGPMFPGVDSADYLAVHDEARVEGWFMTSVVRRGLATRAATAATAATAAAAAAAAERGPARAELLPLDYRGLARHALEGPAFDVAIAQLTPPDADGWCAPGLNADFMPLVWPRARRRVAHLNPRLPRLPSSFRVHVSELDASVVADAPLLAYREPAAGAAEQHIGAQVARLVRDGDTLQFGIGTVPVAVAAALASHRRLRIHGGIVTDALRGLWASDALDRDARIVTGMVLGEAPLHELAATLPQLWLTDVRDTHDPARIVAALREGSRFVAINAALQVDLFGQVNSERAGGAIAAGAGGAPAFAAAAQMAPGGRLVVCLPATARHNAGSRIVPALDADALTTLPRHLADVVVTEHGVAELRSLGLQARAQALIGIAAPEHRAALAAAWQAMRRRF